MRITLGQNEVSAIKKQLAVLSSEYSSTEDPRFLLQAEFYAHELPPRLRRRLLDFKLREPAGYLILSGYPIDDGKLGRTPGHWRSREGTSSALEEEILFVIVASLLGCPIGWATQQDGHIVHDVFPIKKHENEQLGTGCKQLLWWHTEDAFHPFRGDYIGLLCLRNPDRVPTTVCSIDEIRLSGRHKAILFEPRFAIRPDESHLAKNRGKKGEVSAELQSSYETISEMNMASRKISVLSGDPKAPYMRLDPYFMDQLEADTEAQGALDALIGQIDANIEDLPLEAGDLCFIDNYRAVHGRKPFQARYDGTDRWLKRLNLTRDLRKSRSARKSPEALVIH